ncbi:hypothetical protein PVK06_004996 [Gossypium arboreum]|uniref:Reverse transcriptase domain-containing protein n=1 Tax=Gossypium arboreum TaxID=29729 RepID=A0ABR0QTG4_GOSAR|nr:hypothetical protein PVK06_004996 [Gossypium arboreum]
MVRGADEFEKVACHYFRDLFTTKGRGDMDCLLLGISSSISADMNSYRCTDFTEEVLLAVRSMTPTKPAMRDGMPTLFYQLFRHIVGKDISDYCLHVLNDCVSFDDINDTNIVLIPKNRSPQNMTCFRPISLYNVLFKIISKMIVNRLQRVMTHCINEAQSASIPGPLIMDNTLVAFELFHSFRKKRRGLKDSFAVKLDMNKAYDKVE